MRKRTIVFTSHVGKISFLRVKREREKYDRRIYQNSDGVENVMDVSLKFHVWNVSCSMWLLFFQRYRSSGWKIYLKLQSTLFLWNNKRSPLKLFHGNNFKETRVNFEFQSVHLAGNERWMNCKYSSVEPKRNVCTSVTKYISYLFPSIFWKTKFKI